LDDLPALNETSTPVTKPGDLWLLGARVVSAEHRHLRLGGVEEADELLVPVALHVAAR
jgi:hypothetical protein